MNIFNCRCIELKLELADWKFISDLAFCYVASDTIKY